MFARGQIKLMFSILCIGMICVLIVVLAAYAADLKYDNIILEEKNEEIRGEIETLDGEIRAANRIEHIESIATEQLGMVYAKESECIYISQTEEVDGNLAMIIRKNAYN